MAEAEVGGCIGGDLEVGRRLGSKDWWDGMEKRECSLCSNLQDRRVVVVVAGEYRGIVGEERIVIVLEEVEEV